MTKVEVAKILALIAKDKGVPNDEERIDLWFLKFAHVPIDVGMAALAVILDKKTYGFPQTHEFTSAIASITQEPELTWGDAWDAWVKCARRFGSYRMSEAIEAYKAACPAGAEALGTMASDWFTCEESQTPVLRAQFRQRFEAKQQAKAFEKSVSPQTLALITRARGNTPAIGMVEVDEVLTNAQTQLVKHD